MDNLAVDKEKKPIDALGARNDDDLHPDPDGHLILESGCGSVWLVKVCEHYSFDALHLTVSN